ncbi:hypothetical protein ACFXKI_01150 [Streptomyces mirabilis]|uniref:hypothetical protein n=1 Tax=Streptomyces mirabilis TaxID=68239 RepID=UPI0036D14EFD
MQWFLYFVMFWLGFGALSTISMVGKPRQPITSGTAVVTVLISAAIIVGLAVVGMRVAHA